MTPSTARRGLLLIPLLLACFALLPRAQAVVPAPDGGYPGNNTAEGTNALNSLTTGINNTAVGANALSKTTDGGYNAAFGSRALENNVHGLFNMAVGTQALFNNTANANMAVGFRVLFNNTTGNNLTGIGTGALFNNTTGNNNTSIGSGSLSANTTGATNTAIGRQALFSNTTAGENTAIGYQALNTNTTGIRNTATGNQALFTNTGSFNTADGSLALFANTTGTFNTAIGRRALQSNSTGSLNTALGYQAGSSVLTGTGNVAIGYNVLGADVNDTTWIRNVNTTIQPAVVGFDFVTVEISSGRLGRTGSSQRYKEDIKPMDKASEQLFSLKPVTYRYKKEIDSTQTLDYGLVAEDVAKVDPELATRDGKGQIEGVRYPAINAMLLNEFLKEHRKVQELEATVAQQQKGMEVLAASLKEQAAQIQKVSAQLEVKKPAPKVVRNNP